MSLLRAYHGSQETKALYLGRVAQHRAADELIKGRYWEGGRGCAVGCTIHSGKHSAYEQELGIPQILARLEDRIFEGLALPEAKLWPERFLSAINPGADLKLVWPKFAVWLLADPADGVLKYAKTDGQRTAIKRVAELFRRLANGEEVDVACFREAREEAWLVRNEAAASVAPAYAADAAAVAAYAAAAYVADAAAYAADAAAYAADADAYAVAVAAADARQASYLRQSNKLEELLREAK